MPKKLAHRKIEEPFENLYTGQMLSLLLVFLLMTSSASAGDVFSSDSLQELRDCLAGWPTESDRTHPMKQSHDRGNIFFLDQVKANGLGCLTANSQVIAWAKEISPGNFQFTLLNKISDKEDPFKIKIVTLRYAVTLEHPNSTKIFSLEDLKYNCADASSPNVGILTKTLANALTEGAPSFYSDTDYLVKIDSWNLTNTNPPRRRFFIEQIEKTDSAPASVLKPMKEELPSSDIFLEELLDNMNQRFIAMAAPKDGLGDGYQPEKITNMVPRCKKALKSIEKAIQAQDFPKSKALLATTQSTLDGLTASFDPNYIRSFPAPNNAAPRGGNK